MKREQKSNEHKQKQFFLLDNLDFNCCNTRYFVHFLCKGKFLFFCYWIQLKANMAIKKRNCLFSDLAFLFTFFVFFLRSETTYKLVYSSIQSRMDFSGGFVTKQFFNSGLPALQTPPLLFIVPSNVSAVSSVIASYCYHG